MAGPNRTQEYMAGISALNRAPLPGASPDKTDYLVPPPSARPVPKPGVPQRVVTSQAALDAEKLLALQAEDGASGAFLTINPDEGAQLWADDVTDPTLLHDVSSISSKADSQAQARFAHRFNELQDLREAQMLLEKAINENPEFAEKFKHLKLEWTPQLSQAMARRREQAQGRPQSL